MKTSKNFNSKHNPPTDPSLEATDAEAHTFKDFVANDSPAVVSDPKEKLEKKKEYFDAKENPGRQYNINDVAHSQSSRDDFIETVSKFHHADESENQEERS